MGAIIPTVFCFSLVSQRRYLILNYLNFLTKTKELGIAIIGLATIQRVVICFTHLAVHFLPCVFLELHPSNCCSNSTNYSTKSVDFKIVITFIASYWAIQKRKLTPPSYILQSGTQTTLLWIQMLFLDGINCICQWCGYCPSLVVAFCK